MCFAYKGLAMIDNVRVKFAYYDVTLRLHTTTGIIYVSNNTPERWNFWCENLANLFKSIVPNGSGFVALDIKAVKKYWKEHLYIDQVLFSRDSPLDIVSGNFNLLRMPQAQPSGSLIQSVTVEGVHPLYKVVFKTHHCGHNFPLFDVSSSSFSGTYYVISNEGSVTVTVTRLKKASPPIEGSYIVHFKGDNSGPIHVSHEVKPDYLYNALTTMSVGVSKVEASGTCSAFKFKVTMLSLPGKQPTMEIDGSGLKGNQVSVQVKTVKHGGLLFEPIMGDSLRSYHTAPQVVAFINNVPTRCRTIDACTFSWSSEINLKITEINPISGAAGTTLHITGSGFDKIANKNEVTIGNYTCPVQMATETEITCTVGEGSAGIAEVKVRVNDRGFTNESFSFTYSSDVLAVNPRTGSAGGGTLLTITGHGFTSSDQVKVDESECTIESVTSTLIHCRTPTPSYPVKHKSVEVKLVQTTTSRSIGSFIYDSSAVYTPLVTFISLVKTTTWGKESITITGHGFGNTKMPVRVGNSNSTVVSYTDDKIVAYLPSLPDGSYRLVIDVLHKGFADLRLNNIPDIVYTLNVQSMNPDFGSLYGGTDLVITGDGFSLNSSEMSVTVGPHSCSILKLSETFIKCRIEDTGKRHNVSATGHSKILGYGYAWDKDPIVIQVNDYITWTWQAPHYVSDIGYSIQQTATPYDKESLSDGFSSGVKTRKGSYTHHFTVVGVYYYWTGFMDSAKSVYIRGKIQVTELHSYSVQLSVKVLGIESKYLYLTKGYASFEKFFKSRQK
ncbi:Fibrocystin-L [Bulinus truncatus]|nr:Fibrocystin-L [Bulinus truncatus]